MIERASRHLPSSIEVMQPVQSQEADAAPEESMSRELVPLDYQRATYNVLHRTELQAHKDNLTAAQARLINNHYDIQLYFGAHGLVGDQARNPNDLPTPLEYDAAAKAVVDLGPGDTLFVEGIGFSEPEQLPMPMLGKKETAPLGRGSIEEYLMRFAANGISDHFNHYRKKTAIDRLEEKRAQRKVSAWGYATELARINGVRVVKADIDAFEEAAIEAARNKRVADEIDGSRADMEIQARRERQSRNIVKDDMLAHLPDGAVRIKPARKPIQRVLFGAAHKKDAVDAYGKLRLKVTVVDMEHSRGRQMRPRESQDRKLGGFAFRGSARRRVPLDREKGRAEAKVALEKLQAMRGRDAEASTDTATNPREH